MNGIGDAVSQRIQGECIPVEDSPGHVAAEEHVFRQSMEGKGSAWGNVNSSSRCCGIVVHECCPVLEDKIGAGGSNCSSKSVLWWINNLISGENSVASKSDCSAVAVNGPAIDMASTIAGDSGRIIEKGSVVPYGHAPPAVINHTSIQVVFRSGYNHIAGEDCSVPHGQVIVDIHNQSTVPGRFPSNVWNTSIVVENDTVSKRCGSANFHYVVSIIALGKLDPARYFYGRSL